MTTAVPQFCVTIRTHRNLAPFDSGKVFARRLANEVSLHDGLLRGVELTNGRLELLFRAGDQQAGYFDAWLKHDGVGIAEADAQFLQSAVGCPEIELLYDEFDRHEKPWIHRLLFWLLRRRYYEASADGSVEGQLETHERAPHTMNKAMPA